uniref:Transposase n=1 Tax=Steinernema glaseri TaxID=37863 RepID=A0A1I8ABF5_9BILA
MVLWLGEKLFSVVLSREVIWLTLYIDHRCSKVMLKGDAYPVQVYLAKSDAYLAPVGKHRFEDGKVGKFKNGLLALVRATRPPWHLSRPLRPTIKKLIYKRPPRRPADTHLFDF